LSKSSIFPSEQENQFGFTQQQQQLRKSRTSLESSNSYRDRGGGTWDPLPGSLLFSPSHGWLLVVDLSPTQVPVDLPEKMIPKCHIQPRVPLSRLLGSKQFPSFAQWGTVMGFYLLSARKLHSQGSLPEDQKVSPYSSGQQGHPHSHWEANQLRICWASRTDNPMS
jgi:hypothetical protein